MYLLPSLILALLQRPTSAYPTRTSRGLRNAVVENRCSYDVYLWPTEGYNATTAGENHPQPSAIKISSGTVYSAPFQIPSCTTCGMSLKLTKDAVLQNPMVQYEYSVVSWDGSTYLSYDMSFVNCADQVNFTWDQCLAHESGIKLFSTAGTKGCDPFECDGDAQGKVLCKNGGYFEPVPGTATKPNGTGDGWQPVKFCQNGQTGGDLVFVLCKSLPAVKGSIPEP